MKKIITLIFLLITFGCNIKETDVKVDSQKRIFMANEVSVDEVVYDSCVYLVGQRMGQNYIIHKGNCPNPYHNRSK